MLETVGTINDGICPPAVSWDHLHKKHGDTYRETEKEVSFQYTLTLGGSDALVLPSVCGKISSRSYCTC